MISTILRSGKRHRDKDYFKAERCRLINIFDAHAQLNDEAPEDIAGSTVSKRVSA